MSSNPVEHPPEAISHGTAATTIAADTKALAPMMTTRSAVVWGVAVLALCSLLICVLLWQRLSSIQQQLARQSADAGSLSIEAKALSKQASEVTRDTAARLALLEVRINEVALQRTQLEELMQSMSRSRDENLVVDIEAAVRLAQQQAILTGSAEPLLGALRSASQRVARAAQPRLNTLQRALEKDIDRIRVAKVIDIPSILVKLDDIVRLADELPVANAAVTMSPSPKRDLMGGDQLISWWQQLGLGALAELRGLLRVSRIDNPEAALLSPEQAFFLRENLKLTLLNARLGLLARQSDAVASDLQAAAAIIARYFDPTSRKTQQALVVLRPLSEQLRSTELPRIDNTLTALAVAAAGR